MALVAICPECGKSFHAPDAAAGKRVQCPACRHIWRLLAPAAEAPSPPPPAAPQPVRQPPAVGTGPAASVAGTPARFVTNCPQCGKSFQASDQVVGKRTRCPGCSHIWEIARPEVETPRQPRPPRLQPRAAQPPTPDPLPAAPQAGAWFDDLMTDTSPVTASVVPESEASQRACPACGEMVATTVAKCPACNAVLSASLSYLEASEQRNQRHRATSSAVAELSTSDWLFCFFCGNIACIVSLIYLITGNPKGKKLLVAALVCQAIWFFLGVGLQVAAMLAQATR